MMVFQIDIEIKEEYLSKKPSNTAKAEEFVLRNADEYEELIGKPIYLMSFAEIKEMILMQYRNSTTKTVTKNISVLKKYVDYCLDKKIVPHGENRLAAFTTEDMREMVNQQAMIDKFITKEKLNQYLNILHNDQDRAFIKLPFDGVRGRTMKGATCEEILNLTIDDVDEENKRLILTQNDGTKRILEVDISTISVIQEAYKQELYVENNGEPTNNPKMSQPRSSIINPVENYVFRIPGKNKFQRFTVNLLNSRVRRIKKFLDNPYLTLTGLYMSGMINKAMDIYKEKGEVTTKNYKDICDIYNYSNGNTDNYWYHIKALFEQYKELKV